MAAPCLACLTISLGLTKPPRSPFGDLSYGVYICHGPVPAAVIACLGPYAFWWSSLAFAPPLTLLLALASWRLIENPIHDRKSQWLGWLTRTLAKAPRRGLAAPLWPRLRA